jgi:predicted transcriptional regulator
MPHNTESAPEKRPLGRPRLCKNRLVTVNIALDPDVIVRIDTVAAGAGMSRSEAIRQMVHRYLAALEKQLSGSVSGSAGEKRSSKGGGNPC